MRWNEVPKFISTDSCYHVNYGIVSYVKWIKEEEQDMGLQMNPDFQRGHVWTIEQQQKYMEYLFMGGKTGRAFYFNHPSIRTFGKLKYNDYVCADGLQRTFSIQNFLNNELKVFGQYYSDFGEKLGRTEFQLDIYINDLKRKEDVLTWYVQMNSGGTPHSVEEIERVKRMILELN